MPAELKLSGSPPAQSLENPVLQNIIFFCNWLQQLGPFSSCANIGDSILYVESGSCQLSSPKYSLVFNKYKYKFGAKPLVSVCTHEPHSNLNSELYTSSFVHSSKAPLPPAGWRDFFHGGQSRRQLMHQLIFSTQDATSLLLAFFFFWLFWLVMS